MFIDTQEELELFCSRVRSSDILAIDTEFHRERSYYPVLYLIQVASKDEVAVIDPLAIENFDALVKLFTDSSITKIFHACSQDLEVIFDAMGCSVAPIFDTQVAAAFLGYKQQASLSHLVEIYEGVRLTKAESLTDWSIRPLDSDQLAYAADDVVYLPSIYRKMMTELNDKGRLAWVLPEMDALVNLAEQRRVPEEAYLRLKRSSSLTRRQLAVARELAAWRERAAAKRNIPRKRVISDELVVELCRLMPSDISKLMRVRGTEFLSERDRESIISAVKRGLAVPPQLCPKMPRKTRPAAEVEGAVDLMHALVRVIAEREGIAASLIASRDDLLDFINAKKDAVLASGWRYEIAGSQLTRLLEGELGLTVKNGRIEIL